MAHFSYSNRIVAFIDVLGFGKLVDSFQSEDHGDVVVERISEAILRSHKALKRMSTGNFQFTQFSDSFVISALSEASPIQVGVFSIALLTIVDEFTREGMLLRGGIACGKLIHTKKLLFGPAMNRAYELESKLAKVPRIIFDPKLCETETDLLSAPVKKDKDGCVYVDYFTPAKVFYIVPSWLNKLREIVLAVPPELDEKRSWLVSKYNAAASQFSQPEFKARLDAKASDRSDIARDYAQLLLEASQVKVLS